MSHSVHVRLALVVVGMLCVAADSPNRFVTRCWPSSTDVRPTLERRRLGVRMCFRHASAYRPGASARVTLWFPVNGGFSSSPYVTSTSVPGDKDFLSCVVGELDRVWFMDAVEPFEWAFFFEYR